MKGTPALETAVPDAPTAITATAGNNAVSLNFSAAPGAATYNVKRSTTPGGPYTTIKSGLTGTTFTDSTAVNGTKYYYIVTGVNPIGEGAPSTEVNATPQLSAPIAPSGLSAKDVYQAVELKWTASPFADSYNIKRATASGGPYTTVATGVTTTTYDDKSAVGGTTYYYVVSAVNAAGESGNSNETSLDALQGAEAHFYNQQFWVGSPVVNNLFDTANTGLNGVDINWSLGPPIRSSRTSISSLRSSRERSSRLRPARTPSSPIRRTTATSTSTASSSHRIPAPTPSRTQPTSRPSPWSRGRRMTSSSCRTRASRAGRRHT